MAGLFRSGALQMGADGKARLFWDRMGLRPGAGPYGRFGIAWEAWEFTGRLGIHGCYGKLWPKSRASPLEVANHRVLKRCYREFLTPVLGLPCERKGNFTGCQESDGGIAGNYGKKIAGATRLYILCLVAKNSQQVRKFASILPRISPEFPGLLSSHQRFPAENSCRPINSHSIPSSSNETRDGAPNDPKPN